MNIRKIQIAVVACLFALAACTTESDSDELLELESVSACLSGVHDLSGFDENSVTLNSVDGEQILKFPVSWNAASDSPKLSYSISGDTLEVSVYSDSKDFPKMSCIAWAEVSVHGDLDASFLRVNGRTFKLER